jgi:hypothetical protein
LRRSLAGGFAGGFADLREPADLRGRRPFFSSSNFSAGGSGNAELPLSPLADEEPRSRADVDRRPQVGQFWSRGESLVWQD